MTETEEKEHKPTLIFDLVSGKQVYPEHDENNPWIRSFEIPIGKSIMIERKVDV